VVLAASYARASEDCDSNRDFAENCKCFLLRFPCLALYFGADRAPDYPRALKCFEADHSWSFVALMNLNGEGTPRDLHRAEAALKNAHKEDSESFRYIQLKKALGRCQHNITRSCPRVDYCGELAITNFDLDVCASIDQIAAEAKLRRMLTSVRSTLQPTDQATFDRTLGEFKAYQMAEAQRANEAAIEAATRALYATYQAAFVRDNFSALLVETVGTRKLKLGRAEAAKAADEELDRLNREDIRGTVDAWRKEASDKAWRDQYGNVMDDYPKTAAESQLHWVKFRDLLVELAESLYRDKRKPFDPAASMKLAVTKLRIAELRYDPMGSDPAQ
jgi:hypothetical protein